MFQSALGINLDNFQILKQAILEAVLTKNTIFINKIEYGELYTLDFDLTYSDRTAKIRTG